METLTAPVDEIELIIDKVLRDLSEIILKEHNLANKNALLRVTDSILDYKNARKKS